MLMLAGQLVARIHSHGAETYPQECCGALLGQDSDDARVVLGIQPLKNRREDSPNNRFSITPDDVLFAERFAQEKGWELIGWYHSHPDSPVRPSDYDREHAWPWYSYVILRVEGGVPREMRSWRLVEDRASFREEAIEVPAQTSC